MAIAATGNTFKNQNTNFAYKYETTNNEESPCILQNHKHRESIAPDQTKQQPTKLLLTGGKQVRTIPSHHQT